VSIAGPEPRRFEALDGLRGLSALMVVIFHATFNSHLKQLALFQNGWLFVDFFFVLSGFIITATYAAKLQNGANFRHFVWLRLGRLYPLHLFVLCLYLLYEFAWIAVLSDLSPSSRPGFTAANTPEGFGASLLLVHSFGWLPKLVWNTPSWSIGAEFFAYLLFGGAVLMAGQKRLAWAMAALALVAIIYCSTAGPYEFQTANGFARCVSGFALGSLVRLLDLPARLGERTRGTTLEVLAIATVITFVIMMPAALHWTAPLVFALCVAVFASERGALSAALASPPAKFLGDRSYSIYMVHLFTLLLLGNAITAAGMLAGVETRSPVPGAEGIDRLIGKTLAQGDLGLLIYVGLVIAVASLTYRFVEVPSRAWSRRLAERRMSVRPAGEKQAAC
jgi:peptidoglycan/LPS O-acetylase OafA/YrhL